MSPFHERLYVPLSWWIAVVALAALSGWVILVATTLAAGLVTAIVVGGAAGFGAFSFGRAEVRVESGILFAGPAQLPFTFAGDVVALDPAEWRHTMGPGADVRAFVLSRPYLHSGVLVSVTDPRDPAPYWLISSRRAGELAEALSGAIRRFNNHQGERNDFGGQEDNEI